MSNEVIKLEVQTRTDKENLKELAKEGLVPAVLYGSHLKENVLLKMDRIRMTKVLEQAGESTLIDLSVDGKESGKKVLIKDTQTNPIKGTIIHVDFYEVDMNKPIHAQIVLNFIGESNAIKNMGGALIKNLNEIEVKCLPDKLVNHIDIDISKLNNFGDSIAIKDINLPEGMEVFGDAEEVVAIIVEPKEEKEVAPTATVEAEEEKKDGATAEGKKDSGDSKKEATAK